VIVLPLIVNKTRQSPDRNRMPDAPLSAFTSPIPVSANVFKFEINLRTRSGGEFAPLADCGRGELNFFHIFYIA
jgi:hypothetical protein